MPFGPYDRHAKAPKRSGFLYSREKYYYYDNGLVKYKCRTGEHWANETDTNWLITYYIWNDDNSLDQIDHLIGAVNTEAVINALDWNIS